MFPKCVRELALFSLIATAKEFFALTKTGLPRCTEVPVCFDIVVVGGGPAGATVAALLAERGYRVVVVEKAKHPRFHVGESLLPLNLPLFDRLGVRDAVERIAIRKYGVEFVSAHHGKRVTYEFARAWDKRFPYSFEVRRSTFDHLLLRNAAEKGVEVVEGCRVSAVEFLDNGHARVSAYHEDGRLLHWVTRFVVDASGRQTMLATQLGLKERNRRNSSAAVFAHFSGARRLPGKEEGNITLAWFERGWFWFIPLADGDTSVGAVCPSQCFKERKGSLQDFLFGLIASCPEISDRLKNASLASPVSAAANYSYTTRRRSGNNFILVGDACAFVDPVFSTGVYLAMLTAFQAADAVDVCLSKPRQARRLLRQYDSATRKMLGAFTWFIFRIREPAMRELFLAPRNTFRMEEAVLSLLAGDIFVKRAVRVRLVLFKIIYYLTKISQVWLRLRA